MTLGTSWDEFFVGAEHTDVLKLTSEDVAELSEFSRQCRLREGQDWSLLADQVVGAET